MLVCLILMIIPSSNLIYNYKKKLNIINNKFKFFDQNRHFNYCGKIGNNLIFQNCYVVLTYCNEKIPIYEVENVSKKYGITTEYAKCNTSASNIDACEAGIILRWIILNWNKIKNGLISKVIFHHAHENSWHQTGLSHQLNRIFSEHNYFCNRKYGELYRYVIDHPIKNNSAFIRGTNFIQIIENVTNGTSFSNFNRTNSFNIWRAGQGSAFFVDSSLILLNHSLHDYQKMLNNVHKTVILLDEVFNKTKNKLSKSNKLVGETFERSWRVLFTNKSYIDDVLPDFLGDIRLYHSNRRNCSNHF